MVRSLGIPLSVPLLSEALVLLAGQRGTTKSQIVRIFKCLSNFGLSKASAPILAYVVCDRSG